MAKDVNRKRPMMCVSINADLAEAVDVYLNYSSDDNKLRSRFFDRVLNEFFQNEKNRKDLEKAIKNYKDQHDKLPLFCSKVGV